VYAPFIVFLTLLKEAPTIVLARKSFFLSVRRAGRVRDGQEKKGGRTSL